jgi:hypothetical protein
MNVGGMEEGARQAWLAALGIPLYSARSFLPGAKEAEPIEFVAYELAETPVAEVAIISSDPVESEPAVSDAVVSKPTVTGETPSAPSKPQQIATPVPVVAAPKSDATKTTREIAVQTAQVPPAASYPQFHCKVLSLAPNVMGIIALGAIPDLSQQEYDFLHNCIRALWGEPQYENSKNFKWPYNNNPGFPRDVDAAREAFASFLLRQFPPAQRWLVFGQTIGVYAKAALPQAQLVIAPTLHELLKNPIAKRQLWLNWHV